MKAIRVRFFVVGTLIAMCLLLVVACGENQTAEPIAEPAQPTEIAAAEPTAEPVEPTESAPVEAESEPVVIEGGDGPPFYARFGENETFGDGEWVAIVFYRPIECIPAEFNLNAFFDFPGESGPGAFGCAPLAVNVVETWANGPGIDPAPMESEMTGLGAVPVWFFAAADMDAAMADGVVTIGELAAIPSRRVGTATSYTEYLKPSQSNEAPLIRFMADGTLDDGGDFLFDVSYGDPEVADHTTIELP